MIHLLNVEPPSDLVERIGFESDSKPSIMDGVKDVVNLISEVVKNPIGFYCGMLHEIEREKNLPADPHERMDAEVKASELKNYFV